MFIDTIKIWKSSYRESNIDITTSNVKIFTANIQKYFIKYHIVFLKKIKQII